MSRRGLRVASPPDDLVRVSLTLVFIGVRFSSSNQLAYKYHVVVDDKIPDEGPLADALWFAKPLMRGRPGSKEVFECVLNSDGSPKFTAPMSGRYVGIWSDHEQVTKWQAESSVQSALYRDFKDRAKAKARDFPEEALRPFREMYHNAKDRSERAHVLALVISHITKPGV